MQALSTIVYLMHQQWSFLTWSDGIEIAFFTALFYYAAQWLKQDRQQPLLGYMYAYVALTLGSYYCGLFSVSTVLCALCPSAIMVFVLIHQKTLQQNYISLRNLTPRKQTHTANWVELVVRSCLVGMNAKKPIMCVIEQRDSLAQFIWAPFILNSYVQPGLIELLLQTPSYDADSFLWLNHEGKLQAVSCNWQQLGKEQISSAAWHEDAMLYTAKTDAIVLYADPVTHTISLIAHDKLVENLSAPQAVRIISSYVTQPNTRKGVQAHDEANNLSNHHQPSA